MTHVVSPQIVMFGTNKAMQDYLQKGPDNYFYDN